MEFLLVLTIMIIKSSINKFKKKNSIFSILGKDQTIKRRKSSVLVKLTKICIHKILCHFSNIFYYDNLNTRSCFFSYNFKKSYKKKLD
jgi:hypothetical protein